MACGCGELPLESSGVAIPVFDRSEDDDVFPSASAFIGGLFKGLRGTRRVGLRTHFRFRLVQRLQGNFLSHFVLVLAQFVQAIGVLPAVFGIIMLGTPPWLSWFFPWTV